MCSFILLLVCASVTYTRSAKILCVYTTPGHSHVKVFGLLTEELAKNGHELVVLKRGKYENNFGNATLIHLEDIAKFKQLDMLKNFRKPMKGNVLDPKFSAWTISRILHELIDVQLSSPIVQAVLNDSRNFDLIIVEGMFRCGLMFSTKFQVPLVLVTSSLGTINDYETIGSYVHPLFYPDLYMISERQQSVWNRILSLYNFIRLQKISDDLAAIENIKIKQRFDENSITIQDLQNRVQMLFLNVDRIWDYNRPMPPSGFNIGAIHLRPPIPLNDNLTQYFDNSQNGVIYVSMGTFSNMSEVPPDKVVLMTNVLKSLPYDILWKWDDDKLADQNIRYEKWVPQLDVLYHPKLKAFVSHAGLLSTTEAIAANIPLIGLPLRMDQFMNARKFGQFGIGVHFDLKTVTEEELKSGIIDVIADKSYRENIRKLHVILEEQRSGALQRAVRVIERVAKFGGDHLRSPAAMISFAEYFVLDVFVPLIIIFILFIMLTKILMSKILASISRFFFQLL